MNRPSQRFSNQKFSKVWIMSSDRGTEYRTLLPDLDWGTTSRRSKKLTKIKQRTTWHHHLATTEGVTGATAYNKLQRKNQHHCDTGLRTTCLMCLPTSTSPHSHSKKGVRLVLRSVNLCKAAGRMEYPARFFRHMPTSLVGSPWHKPPYYAAWRQLPSSWSTKSHQRDCIFSGCSGITVLTESW